jgi:hypothetical protein
MAMPGTMSLKAAFAEAFLISLGAPLLALVVADAGTSSDLFELFGWADYFAYLLVGGIAVWVIAIIGWWWINRRAADTIYDSRARFHGAMLLLALLSFFLHLQTFQSLASGEQGSSTSVIALLLIPLLSVPAALLGAILGGIVHAMTVR